MPKQAVSGQATMLRLPSIPANLQEELEPMAAVRRSSRGKGLPPSAQVWPPRTGEMRSGCSRSYHKPCVRTCPWRRRRRSSPRRERTSGSHVRGLWGKRAHPGPATAVPAGWSGASAGRPQVQWRAKQGDACHDVAPARGWAASLSRRDSAAAVQVDLDQRDREAETGYPTLVVASSADRLRVPMRPASCTKAYRIRPSPGSRALGTSR